MSKELLYGANLTGASFLFLELKQVIRLIEDGLSEKEIKEKILLDNIFQYEKTSSLKRMIPSLLKRASILDKDMQRMILEEPVDIGKTINLYAIMKTDLLFFEFMNEVIKEKLQTNDYMFEKKDINTYFTYKAEQDEKVAGFSEQTVNKLKQVFIRILLEVGILKDKRSGELNRLFLDDRIKEHLLRIGDKHFVRAMGV